MCGILGHFSFGSHRADAGTWRTLVNLVGHRGPDDSTFWHDGRFAFGHRRLSIIDLAQGHQPMATDDGRLVVTFNGEIYNYIELREQLTSLGHRFRTRSDTEVLLHGYRQWGTDLPVHLRGMFAFAIADRVRHELYVARDRFGEKPLFYTQHANGVAFASEAKVLAALPGRRREVNDESLAAYLCLNYVPGTATMLRGVQRLGPGTWQLWTAEGSARAADLLDAARSARARPCGDDGRGDGSAGTAARHRGRLRPAQRRSGRDLSVGRHRFLSGGAERRARRPLVGGLLPDVRRCQLQRMAQGDGDRAGARHPAQRGQDRA